MLLHWVWFVLPSVYSSFAKHGNLLKGWVRVAKTLEDANKSWISIYRKSSGASANATDQDRRRSILFLPS